MRAKNGELAKSLEKIVQRQLLRRWEKVRIQMESLVLDLSNTNQNQEV
jgi:hypothetical protein